MYDFLLVINSNLPPILHCLRDIVVDRSEIAIYLAIPLLCLREIFSGCQWMTKVPNAVEILPKI